MPRDDDEFILDILLAAHDAVRFAEGLTQRQFEESRLHQNAIIKAIEIVGEAASRLSIELRSAHPEIPWLQVINMRHHLVHGYFEINLTRVWETVHRDLPDLIVKLEPLSPADEL